MLHDRLPAARRVATHLHDLERSMDDTIAKAAAMLSVLPEARMQAKLSATVGQDAFEGAASTLTRLVEARRDLVEMHGQLGQLQTDIGLRTHSMGDDWKVNERKGALTVVDAAA